MPSSKQKKEAFTGPMMAAKNGPRSTMMAGFVSEPGISVKFTPILNPSTPSMSSTPAHSNQSMGQRHLLFCRRVTAIIMESPLPAGEPAAGDEPGLGSVERVYLLSYYTCEKGVAGGGQPGAAAAAPIARRVIEEYMKNVRSKIVQ